MEKGVSGGIGLVAKENPADDEKQTPTLLTFAQLQNFYAW